MIMPYSDRDKKKISFKAKGYPEVLQNCTKTQIISDVPVLLLGNMIPLHGIR